MGKLSVGFSGNILEPTDDLVGKPFTIHYESGKKVRTTGNDTEALKWQTEDRNLRRS